MKSDTISVLILEPNALQCALIKMTLLRHHMNPIVCSQADDFHQKLSQHQPDVILIDTHLPGQNGLDLISQLHPQNMMIRQSKVFFISSFAFPEIVQKAAKIGASGFLVKPLNPDLLAERILNSLGRQIPI